MRSVYADLRKSFLESYKKDLVFHMTVQGHGTTVWRLKGRAKMAAKVRLRSARQRVRGILMKCHGRLSLPPASHWWTPESPPAVLGG